MRQAADLLYDLLRRGGITLAYPGSPGQSDGVGITLQADGGAYVRCMDPARVSVAAAGAVMLALMDRLTAASAMVGTLRSLIDAIVLLGATAIAGLGGAIWDSLLWPSLIGAAYAVLTPLRGRLLRALLGFALRRAVRSAAIIAS